MTEPLLTVVVPAYNAESYLDRALHPFASFGDRVEVVVVDDGSSDDTYSVADRYAELWPDVYRVVTQHNRGHGGAIETGLARARGVYVKVLDADDWVNPEALASVLDALAALEPEGGVDALITDYVHDRVGKPNRITRFDSVFPSHRLIGWSDTARFSKSQYLMMHAIVYRRELLAASRLQLPHHTFYVDSLFVLAPLAHVRRMYYLPVPFYHYFIGREGQSVNADVMLRRVDEQVLVNKLALRTLPSPAAVASGDVPEALYEAMLHYIQGLCAVTSATLARGGTADHVKRRRAFWTEVQRETPWVYARMRRSFVGASSNLPGPAGRRVTSLAYHLARRVVGFS